MFDLRYVKFFPDKPNDNVLVFTSSNGTILEYPVNQGISKHCVYLEGKLYDKWGHEILFEPNIKRLIQSIGLHNALMPVFSVELKNGNFAVARVEYEPIRVCDRFPESKCPYSAHTEKGEARSPILTCQESLEYSRIDNEFFTGTQIEKVLQRYSIKILVAKRAGSREFVFLQSPGGRIVTHYTTKSASLRSVEDQFSGLCIFECEPIFNKTGSKIICKTSSNSSLLRCGFKESKPNVKSIEVELSAEKLDKYLSSLKCPVSDYLDLPFRLLKIS